MEAKKLKVVQQVVVYTVSKMDESEKGLVLSWAEQSNLVVSNKQLSRKEKLAQLKRIGIPKPAFIILRAILRMIREKAWDNQSWARRLGIGGVLVGVATFGSQSAGVAAMGSAIGVPLALLTGAGTTILGVVVDELKKEGKGK